ncbi:MAG: hypothetical protein B6245_05845 [Desulfobacteraceae bacterium 4572_88]|nr:MAG: hypothetical protein B6245_05845 [Desulfobacteraceae bacterium 4572_88]
MAIKYFIKKVRFRICISLVVGNTASRLIRMGESEAFPAEFYILGTDHTDLAESLQILIYYDSL